MQDRVAIVTGSSSGIGRVIAVRLAQLGARLVLISNESIRLLEALEEVRAISPESEAFEADVTSSPCLEESLKLTQEKFGRIDILVNNAGITRDGLLVRMSPKDWDRVLEVNLTSVFHMTRMVLKPMMKARYGRIVNIASVVGVTGNPGQANYVASKAALIGFSKSVALETASRNITVNCVAPGFIRTAMTDALNPKAREAILSRIPLGTMGEAEDVANAVAFLAAERSGYITGETIHVNGGLHMA
ncbi:3-oxoacyl-[acyl-carrier-protein] reductase FabG [Candidatus Magnetaquicoccaceae bacterium FCR-1]|uniref:3-oxoacyl-[acyl-carrier-protein] reductase n=1 Tax=Candidatus Magnetaquiglobus chichijimensis TaxID=3141448 RepID=A0ABQ0C8N6_9PROT